VLSLMVSPLASNHGRDRDYVILPDDEIRTGFLAPVSTDLSTLLPLDGNKRA